MRRKHMLLWAGLLVLLGVVAARHLGFSEAAAESAVRAAVASYCRMMSEYAGYKRLEMWYTQIRLEDLLEFFRGQLARLAKDVILDADLADVVQGSADAEKLQIVGR